DIVEIRNKKEFLWLGRKDNLINTGGVKIIPEQIENHLIPVFSERNYPSNYFLFGSPNEVLGQKLIMVIEGKLPDLELERLIEKELSTRFGKYHIPKQYYYLNEFKRTTSGKVIRIETAKLALKI
ncbi:MAG: O-succinylbenzoic acid--CoA ligase, partial [Cyclobacteriaceae bacterium]